MTVGAIRIDTARLMLRPTAPQDFEAWAAFMADADASKFVGGPQVRPIAWRGFLSMAGAWAMQGFAMFSVIEKCSGRWIGRLGPWQPDGWPGTEVGWGLAREAWGKGYATEGAVAAIDWAFQNLGWTEVIHCIDPENLASRALAAKLGSRILRRTNLPAPFASVTVDVWGQSRSVWDAARPQRDTRLHAAVQARCVKV